MFDISRHLKTLLLEHNCVIVPDLGGFVAQYVPAYYDAEAKKFYPPTRKVAFNSDLTMNDGLLVQSLMQVYDATYPEMQLAVEDKVRDIKEQLFSVGSYELSGIGRLAPNLEGKTEFEPAREDIASPELFGLELVDAIPATSQGAVRLTGGIVRREGNGYVVRVHRRLANVAAATVAALFCYFSWTAPAESTDGRPNEAKLFSTELVMPQAIKPDVKKEKAEPVIKAAPAKETETQESVTEKAEPVTEVQTPATQTKAFTLVVAQGLTRDLAEGMVNRLAAKGLNEAKVVAEGRYFSVHYGGFDTYDEGLLFLKSKHDVNDLAQSWVLSVR